MLYSGDDSNTGSTEEYACHHGPARLTARVAWPGASTRSAWLGAHRDGLAARYLPTRVPVLPGTPPPRRRPGEVRGAARRGLPGGGAPRPERGPCGAARGDRP